MRGLAGAASFAAVREGNARHVQHPGEGSLPVFVKKVFLWGGVAFLIYFVAFRPDGAAQVCRSVGGGLMAMAQGMGDFLTGLTT
ncbi:hypothetical protein BSA16_19005 [Micromonospora sp. Rc5]|nr:hypothetical protein BSA16_19005 [Micromonospora sp. Rc5]